MNSCDCFDPNKNQNMKNLRNSRHILWRAISTLTLMAFSAFSGGGAVYAIIEGGDYSAAFIATSLFLTFGYLALAVLQHFNPFRKLALTLFAVTNALILIMPAILLFDVVALGGGDVSTLAKELGVQLIISALVFTIAFLIPLWVNWPKPKQPPMDVFS